ncbi:hypothetical protein PRIPAC_88416, partial [Pristionchus pacificus]
PAPFSLDRNTTTMVHFHKIDVRPSISIHLPDRLFQQGYRLDPNSPRICGENGIIKKFDCPGAPSIAVKKFIQRTPVMTKDRALLILRELNLLRSMRHPNIVRLVDKYAVVDHSCTPSQVPETMQSIYHITLYCGVPLSSVIARGDYDMAQAKTWIRELLSALQYIHALGISHRDLNPENICISTEGDRKLTILGFGKARVLDSKTNTLNRGNGFYMAIEMQITMKNSYDEMVDIWSMAVILCEMLTGKVLFTGKDRNKDNVKNVMKHIIEYCGAVEEAVLIKIDSDIDRNGLIGLQKGMERKDFQEFLRADVGTGRGIRAQDIDNEPELRSFLDRTLQHNPKARLTADEALCHPFVFPQALPKEPAKSKGEESAIRALLENIFEEIQAPMGSN